LRANLDGVALHRPLLPGRDGRYSETLLGDFTALCDDLWAQLERELDRGRAPEDLVLFGFSMGALLATDMAERLQHRGTGPRSLVVAGCAPPHVMRGRRLARLSDDELTAAIAGHSSTPSMFADLEFVRLMLPVWRADSAAVESHPRQPVFLSCPVLAVGGEDDELAPPRDVALWLRVGGAGSRVDTVPGGHADVLDAHDTLAAMVASAIRAGSGVSS
jgi:surfactin synthase thioesterase subunit